MANFPAPVAGQSNPYNPSQGLTNLSELMGVKNAQAQNKLLQAQLPGTEAQSQQEQQSAHQRAGVAQFFKEYDPAGHMLPDGTLDMNAIAGDTSLIKKAGDSWPQVLQQLNSAKAGQIQNKQAMASLNKDVTDQFGTLLGSARTDPRVLKGGPEGVQLLDSMMDNFSKTSSDAERIVGIYRPMIDKAPPGKLAQMVSNFQLQAQDASGQGAAQKPNLVNKGGTIENIGAPQSAGGDLGDTKPTALTLAPTEKIPYQTEKTNLITGAADDNTARNQIRAAAVDAPMTKNILHNIDVLSGETKTGPGSKDLAAAETFASQYIPGFGGAADDATKRQLLGKYIQQLAMKVTSANGYNTDAARDIVAQAIPDADHMTPDAIHKAVQLIKSQQELAQARSAVSENYVKGHNGSSVGLRAIDSQFMQNVDPRMFDYMNMKPDEQQKFLRDNFKTKKDATDFAHKLAVISHLGGFSYGEQ